MELDHVFHPAHKLTYYKEVVGDKGSLVCAACVDEISSEHYGCGECNFFLHQLCAQRPLEFTHSLHPQHPLRLLHKSPYGSASSTDCSACGNTVPGFIYHCAICEFDIDFICAFTDGSKLNHIFHPEHILTYGEVLERSEKGVVCAACLDEISELSSEHYSCRKCDFFLHKLCSQAPLELTNSSHTLHPLQLIPENPYTTEEFLCTACMGILKGSLYLCDICDETVFHLRCAAPNLKPDYNASLGGSKLNHVSHPHILTFEKVVNMEDKGVYCAACLDEISGLSSEHYSCRKCNFFLHKLCSQAPLQLTNSSHTLHPLQLFPGSPYSNDIKCSACVDILNGFVYHCDICDEFNLHLRCAVPSLKPDYNASLGGSKLNHVCHPHTLTLEEVVKRADTGLVCAACLEEISGPLVDYYSCRKCHFFLHKSCEERPQEITHSLHPQHTLCLLPKDPYIKGCVCNACQKIMIGFVYNCKSCWNFAIDFKCAFPKLEKRIQNLDQVHHHPLIFIPRTAKFKCDLCSSSAGHGDVEEQSYACLTCDFMIHKSCALTTLTQRYKSHNHPLSLVQGVPEALQKYDGLYCDVCRKTISSEDLVSHCARCRYFVHVRCMITDDTDITSNIKAGVDYLDGSLIQFLLKGKEFVPWPARDVASELIQPFLLGKNGIVLDVQPKIRHFSHEQHDMILFQELCVNNDSFYQEEDEEILCDACIHPVTTPYYCCQECNYYLHLTCANLPSQIEHSSHSHELKLTSQKRFYSAFKCDRCEEHCNGFGYECEKCKFALDLTCAALPAGIIHPSHEHPLFQKSARDEARCYACGYPSIIGDQIFKCSYCDVYIHYKCAMFSQSIRHRWDRQHPIDLRFPPHADHPEDFMCDMCEELIHPMRWLYSCFKCDVSFHTECAPRYVMHPNIKYGGKLQINSHPHILKHLFMPTLKVDCDKCQSQLIYWTDELTDYRCVFECETCYDSICRTCVFHELS